MKAFIRIAIGLFVLCLVMFSLTYFFATSSDHPHREPPSTIQGTTQSLEDANSTSPSSGK